VRAPLISAATYLGILCLHVRQRRMNRTRVMFEVSRYNNARVPWKAMLSFVRAMQFTLGEEIRWRRVMAEKALIWGDRYGQTLFSHGFSSSSLALLLSSGLHFSILLAKFKNCAFSPSLICFSVLSKLLFGISASPRQFPGAGGVNQTIRGN
jgi:hypothetical protein